MKDIDRHLLSFQRLAVNDLLKLLNDNGIIAGYGVGKQVINRNSKSVYEPLKCVKRETPFATLDCAHIGIRYVNIFRKLGLCKV